jgi:hypothetical protein
MSGREADAVNNMLEKCAQWRSRARLANVSNPSGFKSLVELEALNKSVDLYRVVLQEG